MWAERIVRHLKPWHVITFWIGFSFDVAGTLMMHKMAEGRCDLLDMHTLTGQLALWLMLAHVIWATVRRSLSTGFYVLRFGEGGYVKLIID